MLKLSSSSSSSSPCTSFCSSRFACFILIWVQLTLIGLIEANLRFNQRLNYEGACGVYGKDEPNQEIKPSQYSLALELLDLNRAKYTGLVEISFDVIKRNDERRDKIFLNAHESIEILQVFYERRASKGILSKLLKATSSSSSSSSSKSGDNGDEDNEIFGVCFNTKYQIIVFSFKHDLKAGGRGRLGILFEGRFNQHGLRKNLANLGTNLKPVVEFALTANNAHRLFPCFDNPKFKTSFKLRVNRLADFSATSNTEIESDISREDGGKEVGFRKTPSIRAEGLEFKMFHDAGER